MSGTLKKVRFKLAWQKYRVGDAITPNGALRDWLVSNGYVDVIDEPSPVRAQGVNRQAQPTSRRAAR
jgi:hypothetical protein